ncbi:MAG: DUF3732 domain-containing protein [Kiritimatiellae bacterium]|nr:DUF3732 domain-containing protein [Kiritimatiellia bacterium]
MKMQIKKLFLVRRGTHEVKRYDFDPGRLNIIIGQGAKGKTTVWSIVDYACCAKECDIDSKIAKAVEWVGVEILTRQGAYVIARKMENAVNATSSEYYLKHLESEKYELDGLEVVANSNGGSVKGILDRLCGIETMTAQADDNGQKISFSIRYLLNIVGQDYRTLSDQKHLFAFKAPQQWQTITKYFASIIGIDAEKLNLLRAEQQKTERELKKLREEYKRALTISDNWKRDLEAQLFEAKRLTMIPANIDIPNDTAKRLSLVRSIINDADRSPTHTYNVEILGDLASRVSSLQERKAGLEIEIARLQVRLEELEDLEKKASAIHREALKVKDRMELSSWLIANWSGYQPDLFHYPYSEGRSAEEVRAEINRLAAALKQYEKTVLSRDKVLQFKKLKQAEKQRLAKQQSELSSEIAQLGAEINALKNSGKSEKQRIETYQNVNRKAAELIGKFRSSIELVEGLADTGTISRDIERLSDKFESDKSSVDMEKVSVETRLKNSLDEISLRSLEIARGIGIDESFKFANLEFDSDKLDFLVHEGDFSTYLKNRKSTANHVAFHVALTAALQELCANSDVALLPDFTVYDQPTQGRSGFSGGANIGEKCFINIAKELARSVEKSGGAWQPILIDSWNSETLDKLGDVDFHRVADLDATSGLVPAEWMRL